MNRKLDEALQMLSAVVPAVLAGILGAAVATAAHDDGVVRVAGAGYTGIFRALDLLVAAPFMFVPVGTRALRGGLASAFVTGICGVVLFDVVRSFVALVVRAALRRIGQGGKEADASLLSVIAAVASMTALVSPAWQTEASAPGGAVVGALVVLLALRAVLAASPSAVEAALLLGLAASHGPLTFAVTLAALAPSALALRSSLRPLHAAVAFAIGLSPMLLGALTIRRLPELALHVPMLAFDRGAALSSAAFVKAEIGRPLLVLLALGAAISLAVAQARRLAGGIVLVVVAAAVALSVGAPAGPNRFDAAILAGIAGAYALAAVVLALLVLGVARARVPFATASATLIVVLELVLPVSAIDETLTRAQGRAPGAADVWTDIAWGAAPPAAVVLVSDRDTMRRIASARTTGAMRGDLVVVPTYDVQGRQGERALILEPKLASLYRDLALGLPPEELSLAQLGSQRAVLATFDTAWDRALSRHFVPVGLMARFEPEPRGASDRKHALEAFEPGKELLVRFTVARKDAELAAATAVLLRSRAIAMAATGEHDMLARALDDLRAFAPEDRVGTTLVRRHLTSKGPIDVRDLGP